MKVLLAAHQSRSSNGIGSYARGLSQHLPFAVGPSHELMIADGASLNLPEPGNVARLELGGPMRSGLDRLWHEQWRLARVARDWDLVHHCDLRPLLTSRTRFMITVHDVSFLDGRRWTPTAVARYKQSMLRAALRRRPHRIVCVSRFTADRLRAHAGSDLPIDVVYQGVRKPEGRPFRPESSDEPYFLTVSDIEPRKNHMTVLEAFSAERSAGRPLRWVVAGRAGHSSRPIVAALRATAGVTVLGHVSDEELEGLYAGAQFVAVPSLYEGFGLPAVEAMARGVPVVCSEGSAFDESVADAGLRVPATEAGEWRLALARLADEPELRTELSGRGRVQAGLFTWDRTAAELASLY